VPRVIVKSGVKPAAADAADKMPPAGASSAAPSKAVLGFDARPPAHGDDDDGDQPLAAAADRTGESLKESAAKCVHETIHQLMFHTRIMSPEVQYPLWICEGFSTAFETNAPEEAFGPDHDFGPRREVFQDLLATHELISLRDLVMMAQIPGNSPTLTRQVYHESYALVTWMCRERMPQVRDYLQSMLNEAPGRLSARRHLELFEQAFGDVQAVERDWMDHEWSMLLQLPRRD